ncbi:MAG TPA: CcdC protein domain-containing protein [Candidatus Saccharimonadales bacterium]|nr:CcdC protein domain-containing protein [Candidatus Saccharimonadales bacterium]
MVSIGSVLGVSAIPIVVIALVAVRLFVRMRRNKKGSRYSLRSIFLLPVIYIALSAYFVLGLGAFDSAMVLASVIVGIAAGLFLGRRSEIFEKEGKIMYRRSAEVMAVWMVGFVIRVAIDFLSFSSLGSGSASISGVLSSASFAAYESSPLVFAADLLLGFSAGLLLGETIVLYREHASRYAKGRKESA